MVVLLVVVLMSALLVSLNYTCRMAVHSSAAFTNRLKALNLARAGLNITIAAIKENPATPITALTNEVLSCNVSSDSISDSANFSNTALDTMGTMLSNTTQGTILSGAMSATNTCKLNLTSGKCRINITEENGKINLNMLKTKASINTTNAFILNANANTDTNTSYVKLCRPRINELLRLIDLLNSKYNYDISYSIVPAIIDWVDADNNITTLPFITSANTGAESAYYQQLTPAINCKNGPLYTIDELLQVRGITKHLLYGSNNISANKTLGYDTVCTIPGSIPNQQSNALANFVTVYGNGKIDINHAPLLVIQSLSVNMTEDIAHLIIQRRTRKPFCSLDDLRTVPGVSAVIPADYSRYITVAPKTRFYRVTVTADTGNAQYTVSAIIKKKTSDDNVDIIIYKEL